VTKDDMLAYIESRKAGHTPAKKEPVAKTAEPPATPAPTPAPAASKTPVASGPGDERIPMTRMGKLIAKHMAESVATSAHVQSFVEVDVTSVVNWREKVKDAFLKQEGEKLTFTPIFMEAVAKALKKYPMMNISVDGDTIVKRKHINLGMAAALPDGNLIVPVIRNADQLNLVGMARAVNDLANRARNNALKPDEIQDGTYTVTNVGTFGSVFGTPIINQPQVGILALGAIRKVPSVIETPSGDFIGIRSKMFLSHSYDHRVVNGALGGMFVKAVADYLEAWDENREI
jgi:2-oxoglutarate dehydrogenase E2 component (dihydrolipoamide succinyltransferase)